eukprot:932298-Rhodomonas_salina.1
MHLPCSRSFPVFVMLLPIHPAKRGSLTPCHGIWSLSYFAPGHASQPARENIRVRGRNMRAARKKGGAPGLLWRARHAHPPSVQWHHTPLHPLPFVSAYYLWRDAGVSTGLQKGEFPQAAAPCADC